MPRSFLLTPPTCCASHAWLAQSSAETGHRLSDAVHGLSEAVHTPVRRSAQTVADTWHAVAPAQMHRTLSHVRTHTLSLAHAHTASLSH
eukprot:3352481-Rhodomonas_salina.1